MTRPSNNQSLEVWRKERTKHSRLKNKEYKTWNKDKRVLELYCEYRGLAPDEVLAEAQQDLDLSYDKLLEYFTYLTKKHKPTPLSHNAGITYFAIVRSFLSYNGIMFTKKHQTPKRTKSKVRNTYKKLPLWGKDKRLNGDFRSWLDGMSKVHRSIALCILSSGQKANMILRLNVDFVTEHPDDKLNLWLDTERIKTGEDVITFFSKEATRRVREYVKVHRKDAKPSDPLFVNERGQRMNVAALQSAFRRATDKLFGDTFKDNPLTPTRLRHLFESACRKAKLDPDIKKLFMGHKTSISGEYNTDNIDELLEEYLRVEPYLTIYEGTVSEEFKAEISKTHEKIGKTSQEVDTLKAEVANLKERLENEQRDADKLLDELERWLEGYVRIVPPEMFGTEKEILEYAATMKKIAKSTPEGRALVKKKQPLLLDIDESKLEDFESKPKKTKKKTKKKKK